LKIREALQHNAARLSGQGIQSARLEAEVLLRHALGIDRAEFFASLETEPTPEQLKRFYELLARRLEHEPLAYIIGHREFYSLDFIVNPDVLIPRQETELLVELALKFSARKESENLKFVDAGTGSGAIAVSIAYNLTNCLVYAVDVEPEALQVAKANAGKHGVSERIKFMRGNLLEELPERVDIVVSNPPYLRTAEIPNLSPEVQMEPVSALDGGPDGLDVIRILIEKAPGYIKPDGCILIEMDPEQVETANAFALDVFPEGRISVHKDLFGLDRVMQIQIG
jgi:release factor glutamine methyltransferase